MTHHGRTQSATALQKISATGEKLKTVGDKITGVGEKLMPVSLAVAGLGTVAVKTAADFDSAMSKVAAVSGATGDEFSALRDKAREMGEKTKFSASEAAEAMNYMAMAGWKTGDMLSGIEGIMNLAAASGESLAATSDIVTDALTAFGLTAADSGHFADILAAASSNANTNVSMMGETFKYAAPVAGALGYSVEDVAVAIGLMANSGIKSTQAGTALRTMLTSLQGEISLTGQKLGEVTIQTTNADGSMRGLGEILSDLRGAFSRMTESEASATAEALVGKNAMSGFLAVMQAAPGDVDKLTSAIANCDGTAENMAGIMQNNLTGQLTVLKSQTEELAISFGELLMPAIRNIVTNIQSFADKLNSLDEGTRNTVLNIALVVAALGPVLIIIGKVISSVGTVMTLIPKLAPLITGVKSAFAALNAVMAANPIGIIMIAIQILGYFDTYEELEQTITRPSAGSTYAVGYDAPYNIYIWDSLNRAWVSNGNIRGADGTDAEVTAENIALALGYTPLSSSAGAVKYANIENGAVGTAKLASASVTAPKIAYGALVSIVNFRLISGASWTQNTYGTYTGVVTVTGADPAKHTGILFNRRQAAVPGDGDWSFELSRLEADEEILANIFSARITALNTLTLVAKEMPTEDIYLGLELIHI